MGARLHERALFAGNQQGKSQASAAEFAMHLTGQYPADWPGYRFSHPIDSWAGGVTGESVRDIVQEKLLGDPKDKSSWGTSMIPYLCIDFGSITPMTGVPDAIEGFRVKHASGGWSTVGLKTYRQGREKWQGTARHLVWFDEEPPEDVYTEGLARTLAVSGLSILSCTPLLGRSAVINRFLPLDDGEQDSGDDPMILASQEPGKPLMFFR